MSSFNQLRQNAIGMATNQSIGQLHKDLEGFRHTLDLIRGSLSQIASLQEQQLAADRRQIELLEQIAKKK